MNASAAAETMSTTTIRLIELNIVEYVSIEIAENPTVDRCGTSRRAADRSSLARWPSGATAYVVRYASSASIPSSCAAACRQASGPT